METETFFKDYSAFTSFRAGRYGKATLFESEHALVGLNCFEPGQELEKHAHQVQCRFYVVLEGSGQVSVGAQQQDVTTGSVVWVPAGQPHRIANTGSARLVMLVGITPAHAD